MINIIDARGLICPLPILRAKQALSKMNTNDILKVITTDPTSALDFPRFATVTGNKLIHNESDGNVFVYQLLVKK